MFQKCILLVSLLALTASISVAQKNAIKTGFLGALGGDFSLSYERATTNNQTINFKIGYWNPSASIVFSDEFITPNAYELQEMSGGVNTSVEYRFYNTNGQALQGWYIAPYLRFVKINALYEDEISRNIFDVDFGIDRFGLGAKIGHQWIVNDVFAVEIFGGLGIDRYKVEREYTIQTGTFTDYNSIVDDVNDWIDDWDYLKEREEHEITQNKLVSKLPFWFPGFELGVNIGIGF